MAPAVAHAAVPIGAPVKRSFTLQPWPGLYFIKTNADDDALHLFTVLLSIRLAALSYYY